MLRQQGFLLFFFLAVAFADDQPFRKFASSLNMGCNSTICNQPTPDNVNGTYAQLPNLLYLQGSLVTPANGQQDTLHVLFTTYGGYPAALMVHCNMSSDPLHFDWDLLLSTNKSVPKFGAIKPPASCINFYSFAVIAVSVIDFNDTDDTANMDENKVNGTVLIPLSHFLWSRFNIDPSSMYVQTDPSLNNGTYFRNNGTLKLQLGLGEVSGSRASDLPQLQFTGNSIQFDTIFSNWVSQFANSRVGLELVVVSDPATKSDHSNTADNAELYSTQSIDDEYTPGTFTITDWITRSSLQSQLQTASVTALDIPNGYLQFKPIAYTKNEYTVENTVYVGQTALKTGASTLLTNQRVQNALKESIVAAFYKSAADSQTLNAGDYPMNYYLSAVNVTFGQVDDGFYSKTSWVRWTAQVGFGVPPQDSVSLLVIITILVGLGIPMILMAAGGIYLCVRKCRANASYDRIN